MTKSAVLLATCRLATGAQPGRCAWCGADLPKRRRTWCADRCADAFWKNHWWSVARRAAKRRDKYRCRRCGKASPKRPTRVSARTEAKFKAEMREYRRLRKIERLEVNHIDPALGSHAVLSCSHHLENLETLCGACHKLETAKQRLARTGAASHAA